MGELHYYDAWGLWLRRMRVNSGLSQQALGIEVDADISRVSAWERGKGGDPKRPISEFQAKTLAAYFADKPGCLERPSDVVDWLGLIGISVTEEELAQMGSSKHWQKWLPWARVATRYQVPPLPQPYVERSETLEQIKSLLLSESTGAPLVLTGLGGSGKSTLAAALAADQNVRSQCPDAVLWARLNPGSGKEKQRVRLDKVLTIWKRALGTEDLDGSLKTLRALIVVDNAETFEEVKPLLLGGPNCRVVITTRNLGLLQDLPPGSPYYVVDALTEAEAVWFLRAILRSKEAKEALLREINAEVKGNILALEIVGQYAKRYGVERTIADLRDPELRWLQILSPQGVNDPNRSVASCFTLSYRKLSSEAKRAYRSLGKLPAPVRFRAETLQALAGIPDRGQANQILHQFVDLSLLRIDGRGFRQHRLLYEFSALLLKEAGEEDPDYSWVKGYDGEIVKQWRYFRPSVPRIQDNSQTWTSTLKDTFRGIARGFALDYDELIAEGWNPDNLPLEPWAVWVHLKRRQTKLLQLPRITPLFLVLMILLAAVVSMVIEWVLGAPLFAQIFMYLLIGENVIFVVLLAWLVIVLNLDYHHLSEWNRRDAGSF